MNKKIEIILLILTSVILFIVTLSQFSAISNLLIPKIENLNFYSSNLNEQFKSSLYFSIIVAIAPILVYFTWKLAKIRVMKHKIISILIVIIFMIISILSRLQILKIKFNDLPNITTEADQVIKNAISIKSLNYEYYLLIGLLLGCLTVYIIFRNKLNYKKNEIPASR